MLVGNPSSREAPATQGRTVSAADSAISGAIRARLGEDAELSRYAIGIRTTDGNVTLTGTVGSYPLRDRAEQIARGTDGVSRVDSRIVVNTNL